MEFVSNLNPQEIDDFVLNHPFSHYMKTTFWAKYKEKSENYQTIYVGVKEKERLVATAICLKKRPLFALKPYLYIPTGMCIDYYDTKLLDFMIDNLILLAKREKVNFLRIDPNVLRCHHNIDGSLVDDGFNNEYIADYLKSKGFFTKGYGYAYNGSWINRYTLKIDLSLELSEIVAKFSKSKQNVLKKQAQQKMFTRIGKREELHYLVDFEWDLTKTQGFKPHKVEFFELLYDTLKNHIYFYVTEISLNNQINLIQQELASNKYNKDLEAKKAKEKELETAQKLLQEYGDNVVIAAGLFVCFGQNSWDLYTYMRKDFTNYNATDNLHRFVIEDMKNKGVLFYDMVGFSGVTTKDDQYYGLYAYKKSFGSDYYEHLGEFDYIFDEKDTNRYKFFDRNFKRVKRKIYAIRYLKK